MMSKHFGNLILGLIVFVGAANCAEPAVSAATSKMHALEQQKKADLQNLNQQMADLKEKHQSEIAPLQQQLICVKRPCCRF
jgi:hypothetical protein